MSKCRFVSRSAAVLLWAVTSIGCDGGIFVRGVIQTEDLRPVADAEFALRHSNTSRSWEGKSNGNGCFDAGGVVATGRRMYQLTLSEPGYKAVSTSLHTSHWYYCTVTLVLESSIAESEVTCIDDEVDESLPCHR